MLSKSEESKHPYLVSDLILEKSFQPFTIKYDVGCHLVIYGLYYVEVYHTHLVVFLHKWILNFIKYFFLHLLR